MNERFPWVTPGIPDDQFARGEAPLTKREVRVLTLAALCLPADGVLWDLGCGTGTVTVEAARLMPHGRVVAVDDDPTAVQLSGENVRRFGCTNVEIITTTALKFLENQHEPADRIFAGGLGDELEPALTMAWGHLRPGGILVVNALLLETLGRINTALKPVGNPEVLAVNLARGRELGRGTMLTPLNPVFIISLQKKAT